MFKKLFGGGWKTITGAFLKFIASPIIKSSIDPHLGELAESAGEALMVVGVAHKIDKNTEAVQGS